MQRRRVMGILAHVDSGKTTLTEQMLVLSGRRPRAGRVDAGTTTTDYLELERERGITIQSAAVYLSWADHELCLIDTPGHVDFTLEVDRSLRVLDGVVIVVDSVSGCQARTEAVAKAAQSHSCPVVYVINKMDRVGADFNKAVLSIQHRCRPQGLVIVQAPQLSEKGQFLGVTGLDDEHSLRLAATEVLADIDDTAAEAFLEHEDALGIDDLRTAIRRATLCKGYSPVLCASALKGVGIDGVLDAICDYLPEPKSIPQSNQQATSRALAFKVSQDKHRGPLVWLRCYGSGLDTKSALLNLSREKMSTTTQDQKRPNKKKGTTQTKVIERPTGLFRPFAEDLLPVESIEPGDIVVASGLKQTVTGETLIPYIKNNKELPEPLRSIKVPPPVFAQCIEPVRANDYDALEAALNVFTKDDPSLYLEKKNDALVLSGLGELHLQIAQQRLERDFSISVQLGPPAVELRESVANAAVHDDWFRIERSLGSRILKAALKIKVEPTSSSFASEPNIYLSSQVQSKLSSEKHQRDLDLALVEGLKAALRRGPLQGHPVADIELTVLDVDTEFVGPEGLDAASLGHCAVRALDSVLTLASPMIIEPIMRLDIDVIESRLGDVLADLSLKRSALVIDVDATNHEADCQHSVSDGASINARVAAHVPLAELLGYATSVRSLTAGEASFTSQYSHHAPMLSS